MIGYVDNRSGFGEEDDHNTGEVEERDGRVDEEIFFGARLVLSLPAP